MTASSKLRSKISGHVAKLSQLYLTEVAGYVACKGAGDRQSLGVGRPRYLHGSNHEMAATIDESIDQLELALRNMLYSARPR